MAYSSSQKSYPGRVLLVTNELHVSPKGGRELLCKLNYQALAAICGENLHVIELPKQKIQNIGGLLNAFRGYIDGLDESSIENVLQTIKAIDITTIFIDGSNLGTLAKAIKCAIPTVRVCTFFHNVEARFFLGSLRLKKSMHALAVLMVNYLAERRAVIYSNQRICLSARDSRLLKRWYGKDATHISPMALEDKLPLAKSDFKRNESNPFVLFVGGTFYANKAGMAWYVEQVVPNINIKTCIVGRGFEMLRSELEVLDKVEVVGEVEDLSDWYQRAQFVVAPIFDGSGMKTKVAEALMFGKKIVGTPEAFSGYDDIAAKAGWICNSAAEFIRAIDLAQQQITQPFDSTLREIYLSNYSLDAAKKRLLDILK
jgi:polysaccharide biosynthesis protein PslH